jgi:hypothetical protein
MMLAPVLRGVAGMCREAAALGYVSAYRDALVSTHPQSSKTCERLLESVLKSSDIDAVMAACEEHAQAVDTTLINTFNIKSSELWNLLVYPTTPVLCLASIAAAAVDTISSALCSSLDPHIRSVRTLKNSYLMTGRPRATDASALGIASTTVIRAAADMGSRADELTLPFSIIQHNNENADGPDNIKWGGFRETCVGNVLMYIAEQVQSEVCLLNKQLSEAGCIVQIGDKETKDGDVWKMYYQVYVDIDAILSCCTEFSHANLVKDGLELLSQIQHDLQINTEN